MYIFLRRYNYFDFIVIVMGEKYSNYN